MLSALFSIAGVFLAWIVGTTKAVFYWHEHIKNLDKAEKSIKAQKFVFSYLAFLFLSAFILLNNFSLPSKVNARPLQDLSGIEYIDAESLSAILDIIEAREGFGSVRYYSGARFDSYYVFWAGNTSHRGPGSTRVEFWYYKSFEGAQADFYGNRGICKRISISDHIKANLYNSVMHRSPEMYLAADWQKHGRTYILIGNLMIIISEEASFFRIGKWTSECIEELTEIFSSVMLENDAETGD